MLKSEVKMHKRLRSIAKAMKLCKFFIVKGCDFDKETQTLTVVCMKVCRGYFKLVNISTLKV